MAAETLYAFWVRIQREDGTVSSWSRRHHASRGGRDEALVMVPHHFATELPPGRYVVQLLGDSVQPTEGPPRTAKALCFPVVVHSRSYVESFAQGSAEVEIGAPLAP